MENFGLIVITPSDETLDGLIDMVQRENARVQSIVDDKGYVPERKFDVSTARTLVELLH